MFSILGSKTLFHPRDENYNRHLIAYSRMLDHIMSGGAIVSPATTKMPTKKYPSGSSYTGQWLNSRWEEEGVYVYPHGVVYKGDFSDSQFHGEGTLCYPHGEKLHGEWFNGKLTSWRLEFVDGLSYTDRWNYCTFPTRAYNETIQSGSFRPPGRECLTNIIPPRKIPPGCYDVGEGFYDPKLNFIVSATEPIKLIRAPTPDETTWIKKSCRYGGDRNIGYQPDLYEYWCSGSIKSIGNVIDDLVSRKQENKGEDALKTNDI